MLFNFGEFFSGPGGMALGAIRAARDNGSGCAMHPVWAVDSDHDSCLTYRLNIHKGDVDAMVMPRDVRAVDAASLPDIDAFLFGFPCNDFSQAGGRKGLNGKFGPLYMEGVRVIKEKNPVWFMAENVTGLRDANDSNALNRILGDLASAGDGYALVPHLYRFEQYGIPQQRHRIVIIGIRRDQAAKGIVFRPPAPCGTTVSARMALSAPMPEGIENNEPMSAGEDVVKRLDAIRPGENIWEAQEREDFPDEHKLNVRGKRLSLIYKRLDPDLPSYTVIGSGGGGTQVYHWDEPRPLTNRERARLQSFPDDYVFLGNQQSVRRQIGMAVPPEGARRIVSAVLKSLAGVRYDAVASNLKWEDSAQRSISVVLLGDGDMAFEFNCAPNPGNGNRRTEIVRALLATRYTRGAEREAIISDVCELAPGTSSQDVRKVVARLKSLGEIEEEDGILSLSDAGMRAVEAGNPFVVQVPRTSARKERKRKPATAEVPKTARSKPIDDFSLADLADPVRMVEDGLGILRRAVYERQDALVRLLGQEGADILSAGVMAADTAFETATRSIRLSSARNRG